MNTPEKLFEKITARGLASFREFIDARTPESYLLDYKRSADAGANTAIHPNDKKNYQKAISGFANAEGGIIIWGIDCSPSNGEDIPTDYRPITNPTRFISWLDNLTVMATRPVHEQVRHIVINEDENTGYVVTLVGARSQLPLQNTDDHVYYIRIGSSFKPIDHSLLAGMFLRRPASRVVHKDFDLKVDFLWPNPLRFELQCLLELENLDLGIAEKVFVKLESKKKAVSSSGQSGLGVKRMEVSAGWALHEGSNGNVLTSNPEIILPTSCSIKVAQFGFNLYPGATGTIVSHIICGADNSPISKSIVKINVAELAELFAYGEAYNAAVNMNSVKFMLAQAFACERIA